MLSSGLHQCHLHLCNARLAITWPLLLFYFRSCFSVSITVISENEARRHLILNICCYFKCYVIIVIIGHCAQSILTKVKCLSLFRPLLSFWAEVIWYWVMNFSSRLSYILLWFRRCVWFIFLFQIGNWGHEALFSRACLTVD